MAGELNLVRFTPTLGGTTDWVYSAAITGYQSPALANAVNGRLYKVHSFSADNTQWELSEGAYNSATGTFARTTILYNSSGTGTGAGQSGAGTKINFTVAPQCSVVLLKEDLLLVDETNSWSATQQAQGRSNLGIHYPPQGRLTLQSGVPVMTATQSAKTTIYYSPYEGDHVPIYDGTNMVPTLFSELSVATTDTTKNPAVIGASKVNDWFVWSDAGTLRLSHGPDWTSDSARSAGTALVMVNGVLLNSIAITNGPGASRGTYVGTTRSNASSQLDWIFGALAAGGTAAWFGVWNTYNRVPVSTIVQDSTDSWTYATNTWRASDNSNAMRISLVRGLDEGAVEAHFFQLVSPGSGVVAKLAIGLDSTSAAAANCAFAQCPSNMQSQGETFWTGSPGLGFHFLQVLEASSGATSTFFGDAGDPLLTTQNGLLAWIDGI